MLREEWGHLSLSFSLTLQLVTLGSVFKTSVPTPCYPLRKRAALKSMILFAGKLWVEVSWCVAPWRSRSVCFDEAGML